MASHSYSFRVWYMDGNYLVILVSVTIILPLALMRQLGESTGSAVEGCGGTLRRNPESHSSLLGRLPRLLQWLLSQLHGVLLDCSKPPAMLVRKE